MSDSRVDKESLSGGHKVPTEDQHFYSDLKTTGSSSGFSYSSGPELCAVSDLNDTPSTHGKHVNPPDLTESSNEDTIKKVQTEASSGTEMLVSVLGH